MDFTDILGAKKEEQVRAWSVEQAILALRNNYHDPHQEIITLSKMIEDFVTSGDVSGVIQAAVDEGYSEGRFQAKERIEDWYNIDLDDLFKTLGWAKLEPESAETDDRTTD